MNKRTKAKYIMLFTALIIYNLTIKVYEAPQINYDDISNDISFSSNPIYSLLEFIKSNPVLKDNFSLSYSSTVDINKYFDNSGNIIYLANVTPNFSGDTQLYIVCVNDDKINKIISIPFSGKKEYFSYDVVNISQGCYIAVYSSTHMGNGHLEFVPVSSPETIIYTIPFVVDHNYEDNMLTAVEHGLSSGNDENITASSIYLGGNLHANYDDIDKDGNTDIVLTGIQRIYETDINGVQILRREYYINNVYLYDLTKDDFFFNENLSKKISIKTDLSNWIGTYRYDEYIPPVIDDSDEQLTDYMVMNYEIEIYKDNNRVMAFISIDGHMTLLRIIADVIGDENQIDLVYNVRLPESMDIYDENEVLISLEKEDTELITVWNKYFPLDIMQMDIMQKKRGVYFYQAE